MNRTRWHLWLIVFALGLAALALPGTVAAAPDNSASLGHSDNAVLVDAPVQPTFAVPGIFSLSLGQGLSREGQNLKLESAQVDLPVVNTTATVNGLTFGLGTGISGWDSITLAQNQPGGSQAFKVSGTQATVHGPSSGYSTDFSTSFEVHPSDAFQAKATVTTSYDGLARTLGVNVQDGNLAVMAGPVNVEVSGLNSGAGTLAIDKMGLKVPAMGTDVAVEGYKVENGRANWDSLSISAPGIKLGNVAAITDVQVNIPGPSSMATNPSNVSANVAVNIGQVAQLQAKLGTAHDPATGQTSLAFSDGQAVFGVPAMNVTFSGINSGSAGLKVDNITMQAQPLNLQAELNGVVMGGPSGFGFDQAKVTYLPQQKAGGFQMLLTKTDAGYVLQTATLIPTAAAQ